MAKKVNKTNTKVNQALIDANALGFEPKKKNLAPQRILPKGTKRKTKYKQNEIIAFYPNYEVHNHPIKFGELVLFMGLIPNAPGHCVVAKYSGEVIWMVHPQDFRTVTEDEV